MLDSNAVARQRRPNNSGTGRATVRMTPCLRADCTVLDVKLIVADRSMVDAPCCHIAVHKPIAIWALVNNTFPCDNAVMYREFMPTDTHCATPSLTVLCMLLFVHILSLLFSLFVPLQFSYPYISISLCGIICSYLYFYLGANFWMCTNMNSNMSDLSDA